MKFILTSHLLMAFAAAAFGQQYPYPEPKPTQGLTPDTIIPVSRSIGPSAYDNQQPAVWDTDIGGGLQVRTNEVDRMNTKWMRLGAIVMDQTDGYYYGVDVLPGTTNLAPWRPLFNLRTEIDDASIYNTSGPLEDFRTVDLNEKSLTFRGVGQFNVGTTGVKLDPAGPLELYGNNTELMGRTSFKLRTPGTLNNSVSNNWVLTLLDRTTGLAEWAFVQSGTNGAPTNIVDTSIYQGDGGILTDRTLSMNQHNLAFDGGGAGNFYLTNLTTSIIGGQSVKLAPLQSLLLSTQKARSNQVSLGDILVVNALTPDDSATLEFAHPTPVATFYTTNANVTGDRTVTFTGNLQFGANAITLDAPTTSIEGGTALHIITPLVNSLTAPTNGILTLVGTNGLVEFVVPAEGKNIYNTSDVLTSDRVVTGGGRSLAFQGMSNLVHSATNKLTLQGLASLEIKGPNYGSAVDGDVLKLNGSTGGVEYKKDVSVYTADGWVTEDRAVYLTNHGITFFTPTNSVPGSFFSVYGAERFISSVKSNTMTASDEFTWGSPSRIRLSAPGQNTSANGKVLMVTDASYATVDLVFPTNIYSGNGTLLSHRTIQGGSKDFSVTNVNDLTLQGSKIKLVTPAVRAGLASTGWTLVLTNVDGTAEFSPTIPGTGADGSIYANDGSLTNNRNVNLAGKSLNFTNGPLFAVNSVSNVVIGTGADWNISGNLRQRAATKYTLETPRVVSLGAAAMNGQILTLATDGSADFQPFTPSGVDTSIYKGSGDLVGDTVANVTNFTLSFVGNRVTVAATNTILGNNNKVALQPNGYSSAANGTVLTKIGSDGSSAWQAIPPVTTLYTGDGTLTSSRFVHQNHQGLIFDGGGTSSYFGVDAQANVGIASLGTLSLSGGTNFIIKTPKVYAGLASGITSNHVLTLKEPSFDGSVEYKLPSSIYHQNGRLIEERVFDGNRHGLTMGNFFGLTFQADELVLSTPSKLKLITSAVGTGSVPANWVLTTIAADGQADWRPIPVQAIKTIYNADDSVSSPRKVSMIGNSLTFQGPGNWTVTNASAVTLRSLGDVMLEAAPFGTMRIRTPLVAIGSAGSGGQVLTLENPDGTSEFRPLPVNWNIYNTNGTLASHRTVEGGGKYLTFDHIGNFYVNAINPILKADATGGMYFQTPNFAAASNTWVLTLVDKNTGKVEYQPPPSPGTPALPQNTIYNNNDSLISDRTVGGVGGVWGLKFDGMKHFQVVANAISQTANGNLNLAAAGGNATFISTGTMGIGGSGITTIGTSGRTTGNLHIITPLVQNSTDALPKAGHVLTLAADGSSEYQALPPSGTGAPDNTIYNASDELRSDRRVGGSNKVYGITFDQQKHFFVTNAMAFAVTTAGLGSGPVSITAAGAMDIKGGTLSGTTTVGGNGPTVIGTLQPSGTLRIRTPLVQNDTNALVKSGQVLTLSENGTVEFKPVNLITNAPLYFMGLARVDFNNGGSTITHITVTNTIPPWPFTTNNLPADGTRLVLHLVAFNGSELDPDGFNASYTSPRISMPGDRAGDFAWGSRDANWAPVGPGTIRDGMVMDLVFNHNLGGAAFPDQGRLWAFMNNTLQLTDPEGMVMATSTTVRISSAGVADLAGDLASAPLTFKKISTLGAVTVGDGKHADYYLTAYDPVISERYATRSTIDTNKMWRMLISK